MKKKCIIYGNCQIEPLRQYLMSSSSFSKIYTMVEVPPVHLCDREKGLDETYLEEIYNCDLFIYQKVSQAFGPYLATDYIMSNLPNKCLCISFPVSYFTGYFPQFISGVKPYTDKNVVGLLKEGKTKTEIISILADEEFYTFNDLKKNLDSTLSQLKNRSVGLDITLDNYIEDNFKDAYLFFTVNHPNYQVIRHLAMKILSLLEIPNEEISGVIHHSHFRRYMLPIYPSVVKQLNLNFFPPEKVFFTLENKDLSFDEYMSLHIDLLKNNLKH